MNAPNFIREVKAAVSGRWPKKSSQRKTYKTAEEICTEELNKPEPKTI